MWNVVWNVVWFPGVRRHGQPSVGGALPAGPLYCVGMPSVGQSVSGDPDKKNRAKCNRSDADFRPEQRPQVPPRVRRLLFRAPPRRWRAFDLRMATNARPSNPREPAGSHRPSTPVAGVKIPASDSRRAERPDGQDRGHFSRTSCRNYTISPRRRSGFGADVGLKRNDCRILNVEY